MSYDDRRGYNDNNRWRSGSSHNNTRYRDKSPDRESRRSYRDRARDDDRDDREFRDREKPKVLKVNVKPSGLLAKESNNAQGKKLKYAPPVDEAIPQADTKPEFYLYMFKGEDPTPKKVPLVGFKSFFSLGSEEGSVDIVLDDPKVSRQHAAIQFKQALNDDGGGTIKPYVIDLSSRKGTFLNDEKIPSSRFVELKNKDSIRFGDIDSEVEFLLIIN
ncbi:unnamed protein product [Kuraishia capsulata CBS 1993]|uniref:FHA domain-containing protein n=1 Tax=Kuraishia capsulata CBS 1993 TaxID=1382522 RepID=W6MH44_9ASCO|nr:uncharacterized protein KUCA_T00001233001 [Kuraishia capsulata CBS 1993]CDK25266.1 unnamed protein product [Kuraishia capsulata CBS 1993]